MTEFDEVDSAFANFNLRDPAMRNLEPLREFALRNTCMIPCGAKFLAKCCVLRSMLSFLHCSDY